ncbi:MAG: peptidylprolyl isomerase [Alphaproteobacteria bacterium]|nr:peptidylprolyl isomerase [Alphaproteobacteria bacterium]
MMSAIAPGITVNGIKITPDEINAEVQYHPAENLQSAKFNAMKALVIREMLIQRAVELGIGARHEVIKSPDQMIDSLLEQEINVPDADFDTCLRYYKNNSKKFVTSPIFEVSHVLYLAPPEDSLARKKAKEQAQTSIERLKLDTNLFESIARKESGCSSAKDGGRLGQISKGQTMPAFEMALLKMQEGEISSEPVETEVGLHVIKVHKRAEGAQIPFDAVEKWIKDYLAQESWNRAFCQYIQLLAGKAQISGFRFEGAQTPLVQ